MTKISNIYDQLRSEIPALLTGKTEIPNPYSLEDNTELFLKDGWGLIIGDGANSEINYFKEDTEARQFTIIVTKQIFRVESDESVIPTQSKVLLEDLRLVKNDMLDFDQLTIGSDIQKIDFVQASGIQFLQSKNYSFLFGTITILIDYSETI